MTDRVRMPAAALLAAALLAAGCKSPPAGAASPAKAPAKVENRVKEADLTRVVLTPEAEQRLGIQTAAVTEGRSANMPAIAGEVMVVPGKALTASAPVAAAVQLVRPLAVGQTVRKGEAVYRLTPLVGPQRDVKITYEADVQTAKARLDNATLQLNRAKQLLRDLAGSQRNVDAAEQEFGQAKAAYDAAVQRLEWLRAHPYEGDLELTVAAPETGIVRQLLASNGQIVAAGAALIEVADLSVVWLRVPVYSGDTELLAGLKAVRVRDVDGGGAVREGVRAQAPPTADPLAVTTDFYYEISNSARDLNPGQRMAVILPARGGSRKALSVPASAITYDIHGGAWVYVEDAPHTFRRQRVELIQTDGGQALLSRGLAAGAKVAVSGVAELFGTEFGAGK